jgi:hypothetical protein
MKRSISVFVALVVVLLCVQHLVYARQSSPEQSRRIRRVGFLRIGADPVDIQGSIDWNAECLIFLTESTGPITVSSGSGKTSTGRLDIADAIVASKESLKFVDGVIGYGVMKRVAFCKNDLLKPLGLIVKGKIFCGPVTIESQVIREEGKIDITVKNENGSQNYTAELADIASAIREVAGAVQDLHLKEALRANRASIYQAPSEEKGWMQRNWKWLVPVFVGAGLGVGLAFAGGSKSSNAGRPSIVPTGP